MKNASVEEQDYKLWVLLSQAKDAVFKARGKELSQYGITGEQSKVLFSIHAIGERVTPAEICRWQLRESQTVSAIINRMTEKDLIRKDKDLNRKNLVIVKMTGKGHEAYHNSSKRESIHRIFSCLTEEERHALMSCLRKIRDSALKETGMRGNVPYP